MQIKYSLLTLCRLFTYTLILSDATLSHSPTELGNSVLQSVFELKTIPSIVVDADLTSFMMFD